MNARHAPQLSVFVLVALLPFSTGCFVNMVGGYGGSGYSPCPDWIDSSDSISTSLPEPRAVAVFGDFRIVAEQDGVEVVPPAHLKGSVNWDVGIYSVSGADAQGYPVTDFSTGGAEPVEFQDGQAGVYLGGTSGGAGGYCQGCGDPAPYLMTCASLEYEPTLTLNDGARAALRNLSLRRGTPTGFSLPELFQIGGRWETARDVFHLRIDATFVLRYP